MRFIALCLPLILLTENFASADETLVQEASILGLASMEQAITYHPSKTQYGQARDDTLARLRDGDNTAMVNPAEGPWMRVVTTAKVGFEIPVGDLGNAGALSGREHVRQISAAEEALFIYNNRTDN